MHARLVALLTVIALTVFMVHPGLCQSADSPQYEDTFDTFDPAMGEENESMFIQDGVLVLKPAPGYVGRTLNEGMVFDDADISVRVRQVGGEAQDNPAGLLFWAAARNNYYRFTIVPNGRLGVQRMYFNRWLNPIWYKPSEAVKQGLDEWNELRVVTEGNKATLYVNGTEIGTFQGQPASGGSFIGLEAESPGKEQLTWEFDDLRVQ